MSSTLCQQRIKQKESKGKGGKTCCGEGPNEFETAKRNKTTTADPMGGGKGENVNKDRCLFCFEDRRCVPLYFKKNHSRRFLCCEFNVRLITYILQMTKITLLAGGGFVGGAVVVFLITQIAWAYITWSRQK